MGLKSLFKGKRTEKGSGGSSAAGGSSSGPSNDQIATTKLLKKEFPTGLKEWHSSQNDIVDIVFIHGLTGNRDKTWTAPGTERPWPQALLPTEPGFSQARILTFGYDAYVADLKSVVSKNRIGEHARNLISRLANYRDRDETNDRPIIFVVHSLGGLVCEDALFASSTNPEPHLRAIADCTYAIAFLGTPQRGSSFAPFFERLAKTIGLLSQTNPDILRVLRQDSETLARVKDGFFDMARRRTSEPGKLPINFTCFFEELPLAVVGTVVEMDSATIEGHTKIGIHANHMDMTKFSSKENQGFIDVSSELLRWTRAISRAAQQANAPPPTDEVEAMQPIQTESPETTPGPRNSRLLDFIGKKNEYTYSQLLGRDHIRILGLWPGDIEEKIRCSIIEVPLQQHTLSLQQSQEFSFPDEHNLQDFHGYRALTYVWGTEPRTCEIDIYNQTRLSLMNTQVSKYCISPHLYNILRHLRHERNVTYYWIDALCIDQDSVEEKKAQIELMPKLFNSATSVILWLGNGDLVCEQAFQSVSHVLELITLEERFSTATEELYKVWVGIWKLLRSEILTRKWAVQEILYAKEIYVQYGDFQLSWQQFSAAAALFSKHLDTVRNMEKSLGRTTQLPLNVDSVCALILVDLTQNLFVKSAEGKPLRSTKDLENLVCLLQPFRSANPHDAIYACLDLAEDTRFANGKDIFTLIRPDYTQSPAMTYRKFTEYCVSTGGMLDIICRYWAPSASKQIGHIWSEVVHPQLPSWIRFESGSPFGSPKDNNEKLARLNADSLVGLSNQNRYNSHLGIKAITKFEDYHQQSTDFSSRGANFLSEPKSLFAKGITVDLVQYIAPRTARGLIPNEYLLEAGLPNSIPKGTLVSDAIWRTLVADRGPNGTTPPIWYQTACTYWLEHTNGDRDVEDYINYGGSSTVIEYLKRVQCVVRNRRFIQTEGVGIGDGVKRFGIAPQDAREGDVVCILLGCSVPVVLRRVERGDEVWYNLIGECYVDGLMDGYAVSEWKRRKFEDIETESPEFELR